MMAAGDVGGGGALLRFSSKLRLYVVFPAMLLILAVFSLLLRTLLLNAKNCGSHAERRTPTSSLFSPPHDFSSLLHPNYWALLQCWRVPPASRLL